MLLIRRSLLVVALAGSALAGGPAYAQDQATVGIQTTTHYSIADWAGFWYTTDFSLFTRSWFKGAPWEDPADYAARSPITYVTRIKTPLMLIEGDADLRTPPADGGEQMFRALRYLKRPVVMVRFPGESHELSRSEQPWHRIERLRHLAGWFDKYLQGKAVAGYDVP